MAQEFLRSRPSNAAQSFNLRSDCLFAALLPMESNRETVCFISDLLQKQKARRLLANMQGYRIFGVVDLFEFFGNAGNRNLSIDAERFQRFAGTAKLAFAAVDENEIGELPALFEDSPIATSDNFLH